MITEHTYRQRLALIAQTLGYSVSTDLDDGIAGLALIDDTEQARKVSDLVDAISGTVPPKTDMEHRYVDSVHPHSGIARQSLVGSRGWPDRMPGAGDALRDWSRQGVRIFSGSATNFRADRALGLPPRATATTARSAASG